jgi:AraC-like DNA-binding protein
MKFVHASSTSRLSIHATSPITAIVCDSESAITIAAGAAAIVCPVFGSGDVATNDAQFRLNRGDVYVCDHHSAMTVEVNERGLCVIFAGGMRAWKEVSHFEARPLFSALFRKSAACRDLMALARDCAKNGETASEDALLAVVEKLQLPFEVMIARCPGARLTRRIVVFARLQRVRNYIQVSAHRDLDVSRLALMANYSVTHFITTFRNVFLETPYSMICRYRMETAQSLLMDPMLGIRDVAQASGFESRSSFSRAIHRHLGASPTGVRQAGARMIFEP